MSQNLSSVLNGYNHSATQDEKTIVHAYHGTLFNINKMKNRQVAVARLRQLESRMAIDLEVVNVWTTKLRGTK